VIRVNDVSSFFYLKSCIRKGWHCTGDGLLNLTERHKLKLAFDDVESVEFNQVDISSLNGLILEMASGLPESAQLRLAGDMISQNKPVFFYWPLEQAVEKITLERIRSISRHRNFAELIGFVKKVKNFNCSLGTKIIAKTQRSTGLGKGKTPPLIPASLNPVSIRSSCIAELDDLIARSSPVSFDKKTATPQGGQRLEGTGVYLRMDFWAPISSGGSYGHTCYVAKNLAATTENFIAFMAHRYDLLDEMNVRQTILEPFTSEGNETNILKATSYYHNALASTIKDIKPAYIYERICLGNYVSAKLSIDLNIPYIVEYNGSEISMRRSFDDGGYEFEDVYLKAEALAFKQATVISVVSDAVRDDLLARGVLAEKILVNPNGADPVAYSPALDSEKSAIKEQLRIKLDHQVIGFSGTFGGWHGVDILADSLKKICEAAPKVSFLMIGDGNFKHLIDEAVLAASLEARVICVGRVPQVEGARYLKACDIFVSPHNSHMVDSRFFGSPTKIFEYMSVGGGIIASNLEQIGEVLSPAIDAKGLKIDNTVSIVGERSILCEPGNLDEFVSAVLYLIEHPDVRNKIGKNAREAVLSGYSWAQHVNKLWVFAIRGDNSSLLDSPTKLLTNDEYKDEVQNQWDNDACGSHYVKEAEHHTLDWYKEVESYRYEEYAPWMVEVMEFGRHGGEKVLEIGAGIGTDLAQYAQCGAIVTDLDLSSGHLAHARENFELRGLEGEFIHQDAEDLPFRDDSFDLVYSNGVIHHTPNTDQVVSEIYRVLKPGGKAIVMVYAENSLHYWYKLVYDLGIRQGKLNTFSMGEIMSETVEISENGAKPLVKVYTPDRIQDIFVDFESVTVEQTQITKEEVPAALRFLPINQVGSMMGWNLVIKAYKPVRV